MATSNAPAGGTYRNVEHAGQCTLQDNANGYPETENSAMIPPKFVSKYPEPIDESTGEIVKTNRTLTKKEENRFTGLTRNASGEEAEYTVFKAFEQLVQMKNDPPLLIIRNYVLHNFKANVLAWELGMNFDSIHTVAEFDAVVTIKDTGLVLVEVKRQYTKDQQAKAEDQLQNGKLFFEQIMSKINKSGCYLPIMKVIIFPEEESASPTSTNDCDTHVLHKDMLVNFNQKWKELENELKSLKSGITFASDDYQRFTRIIVGVWCMQKYQKRFYRYNNDEASSLCQLQHIDNMVNRAILTSDVRAAKDESNIVQPITDVELWRPKDGSSTNMEADLIYLSPAQKNLYQNVRQAIIRASAGAGKTLLANLKIVDILRNHPNKNILIIAPDPHHLRMEQFLRANGGEPTVIKRFPPPVSSGVFIITLRDFFHVEPETLQSYDISMFHVIIDDLQSLCPTHLSSIFDDVADLIERTYTSVVGTDRTLWCALDVGQSVFIGNDGITSVSSLFNISETTTRQFTIPIYTLNKILRNSVEIATVVQKVRELRVTEEKASSRVLTNNTIGHRIRSETVTYHTVIKWTGTVEDWLSARRQFALKCIKEEVSSLVTSKNTTMKWSDVAIIYTYFNDDFEEPVRNMLVDTFNITTQTISEHIKTNNTNAIICDDVNNAASFECPCVLYLYYYSNKGNYFHYNAMTRARTKLVVVDMTLDPPLLTDNVIQIKWEEKDGAFYKL